MEKKFQKPKKFLYEQNIDSLFELITVENASS